MQKKKPFCGQKNGQMPTFKIKKWPIKFQKKLLKIHIFGLKWLKMRYFLMERLLAGQMPTFSFN